MVLDSQIDSAVKDLLLLGCEIVVVTLGAEGAAFASKGSLSVEFVPARKTKAVDTTVSSSVVGAVRRSTVLTNPPV